MRTLLSALFACLFAFLPPAASAQEIAGCTRRVLSDPPRQVLECAGGMIIEADAAARMKLLVPAPGAPPRAAVLDAGAALIEVTPGGRSFQIRSPHAIASVRGTIYAVEVTPGGSAVFVRRGQVSVTRAGGGIRVLLGPGQGVDVAPGKPLVVRDWGAPRIDALLSRFGR